MSARLKEIQALLTTGQLVQRRLAALEEADQALRENIAAKLLQGNTSVNETIREGAEQSGRIAVERKTFDEGRDLINSVFSLMAQGLHALGVGGDEVDAAIDAKFGITEAAKKQKVVVDADSLRVTLGEPTDIKVAKRGADVLVALSPGQELSVDDLRRKAWARVTMPAATVADAINAVNTVISPVLDGQDAVVRTTRGVYRRHPEIRIAGESGQLEAQAQSPRKVERQIDFTLGAAQVSDQTKISRISIRRWSENGVLISDFHFHKKRKSAAPRFSELAVVDLQAVKSKADSKGKRVSESLAKDVITRLMKARGPSGGDTEDIAKAKPETTPQVYFVGTVAEKVGLLPSRLNYLADLGYVPTINSPGGKRLFTELRPKAALDLAKYLKQHPDVKNVKSWLLKRLLGDPPTENPDPVANPSTLEKRITRIKNAEHAGLGKLLGERFLADRVKRLIPGIRSQLSAPAWGLGFEIEVGERLGDLEARLKDDPNTAFDQDELKIVEADIVRRVSEMVRVANNQDLVSPLAGDSEGLKLVAKLVVELRKESPSALAKFEAQMISPRMRGEGQISDGVARVVVE